jgi:uncharacterized protein (TIGR03118 family)
MEQRVRGWMSSSILRLLVAGLLCGAAVGVGAAPAAAAGAHGSERNAVRQVNLVSDVPGAAQLTDPDLVNAWGLALGPTSPLWVADNGTDKATLYTGGQRGSPVAKAGLVVDIPSSEPPNGGAPTGQVFNGTSDFVLHTGGKTGPARFLFAGEDGDLIAWNGTGDATKAVVVAHVDGAVFKGLALLQTKAGPFLLVTNFRDDRIEIFDKDFTHVSAPRAFRSKGIPAGFAPFNVAVIGNRVFVTYAKQDADKEDDVAGPGNGFINTFSSHGRFLSHFARRGVLNSPWGMTIAPDDFGKFEGKLLVGNFGDGRIHVFNPRNGDLLATLRRPSGSPIEIDGLWALLPGTDVAGGRHNVWFSAGPDDESHGLLGLLEAVD